MLLSYVLLSARLPHAIVDACKLMMTEKVIDPFNMRSVVCVCVGGRTGNWGPVACQLQANFRCD